MTEKENEDKERKERNKEDRGRVENNGREREKVFVFVCNIVIKRKNSR